MANNIQRDVLKIARSGLNDRVVPVRLASIYCLQMMSDGFPFLPPGANVELDRMIQELSKTVSLEPTTVVNSGAIGSLCCGFADLQRTTADLMAFLLQNAGAKLNSSLLKQPSALKSNLLSPPDALLVLGLLFTKGTTSSTPTVLRSAAADLLTSSKVGSVIHEVRYTVSHAYIAFVKLMGSLWLSQNLGWFLDHICSISAAATKSVLSNSDSTHQHHVDLLVVRRCILHIFSATVGSMLSESTQLSALLHLSNFILRSLSISKSEFSTDGAATKGVSTLDSVMVLSPNNTQTLTEMPVAKQQEQHNVHAVVCALQHMSSLTTLVGDAIVSNPLLFSLTSRSSPLLEALFACLAHSHNSVRTSACLCLRSVGVAYPPCLPPLIERCAVVLKESHDVQLSPEVVFGFGMAIATLISAAAAPDEPTRGTNNGLDDVASSAMFGLPPNTIKAMFDLAVHLLHCVPLTLRLSEARASVAYLILGAIVRHSSLVVQPLLPRLLALCLRVFPKGNQNSEDSNSSNNGNSFTWQVMMEARTVVLSVLEILVLRWPYIFPATSNQSVATELYMKLLSLGHRALAFVEQLPSLGKTHGTAVKMAAAAYRSRLYSLLFVILQSPTNGAPTNSVSGLISNPTVILREIVADLTLIEPVGYSAASAVSLLFGTLGQNHLNLLLALGPSTSLILDFPLALEHDPNILITQSVDPATLVTSAWQIGQVPRSSNLCCNAARLLSAIMPSVPPKHCLQIVCHFGEAIKQSKSGSLRQQAIQCNLLAVLLLYFRNTQLTSSQQTPEMLANTQQLLQEAVDSKIPIIRMAGAEAFGRLAVFVKDTRFAADLRSTTENKLRTSRDLNTRICQSLVLGSILCQCGANHISGGVLSLNALNHCVGLLLGLAQDHTATSVQAAALHALAITLDANGPLLRPYAESLVTLLVSILIQALGTSGTVSGSSHLPKLAARCINAIITTLGPELSMNTSGMDEARSCILTALSALMNTEKGSKLSPDTAYAQAEALSCYQQLYLYAPKYVSLLTLVPQLFDILQLSQEQIDVLDDWSSAAAVVIKSSPLVVLRRAAASCLRQLAQREPQELIDHAVRALNEDNKYLESYLFNLLDVEIDAQLRSDIHETLISLLQSIGIVRLQVWLTLIRDVLSRTSTDGPISNKGLPNSGTKSGKGRVSAFGTDADSEEEGEEVEEASSFGPVVAQDPNPPLLPRWRSRVFAVNCLTRLMDICHSVGDPRHFDLQLATKSGGNSWLVTHLPDIVRLVSLAATHPCLSIRLAGLTAMRSMICLFAETQDPELPLGSSILEQYQAQMGASLRPAFAPDAPPYITADACDVCSAWLASGITREPSDLRRIHILLVGMLNRLEIKKGNPIGLTEATEIFGVLRAWAEVYVEADHREEQSENAEENGLDNFEEDSQVVVNESLVGLVAPNLNLLGPLWLCALRDYALLTFVSPNSYGTTANIDSNGEKISLSHLTENLDTPGALKLCQAAFPSIVQAASLWLISLNSESSPIPDSSAMSLANPDSSLLLVVGACAGTLCERLNIDPFATLKSCLKALTRLFLNPWAVNRLSEDFVVVRELLQITYRLLLVRELTQKIQPHVVDLATAISKSLATNYKQHSVMMSSASTTAIAMTASPSLLGISMVGSSKSDLSPSSSLYQSSQTPYSGDVVVAERVLLAIAYRVLSADKIEKSAGLACQVLELLASLPSIVVCHPTTTPSIFRLMVQALSTASHIPTFPKPIIPILAGTFSRLVSPLAEHCGEEPPTTLTGSMIWRLVSEILLCLANNAHLNPSACSVVLIECILVPLSVSVPAGSSSCSESQLKQICNLSTDIVNASLNCDHLQDCLITLASLRRLVVGLDLSSSVQGGCPFAAELIANTLASAMHCICAVIMSENLSKTAPSGTTINSHGNDNTVLNVLTNSVAVIRAIVDLLSTSGSKNRMYFHLVNSELYRTFYLGVQLLEVVFKLFGQAALMHNKTPRGKPLVSILSDCIGSLAQSNVNEFREITTKAPALKQLLHEVLTSAKGAAEQSSGNRKLVNEQSRNPSSTKTINLKMDFSHHMSKFDNTDRGKSTIQVTTEESCKNGANKFTNEREEKSQENLNPSTFSTAECNFQVDFDNTSKHKRSESNGDVMPENLVFESNGDSEQNEEHVEDNGETKIESDFKFEEKESDYKDNSDEDANSDIEPPPVDMIDNSGYRSDLANEETEGRGTDNFDN